MPTVYVTNQSSYFDYSPAEKFGNLCFLIHKTNPGYPLDMFEFDSTLQVLNHGLANFEEGDYLLPIGDLSTCCAAAVIAAKNAGGNVRFLRWDKRLKQYLVRDLNDFGFLPDIVPPKLLACFEDRDNVGNQR